MGYKHSVFNGWKKVLPLVGSMGCASAMVVLLYDTFVSGKTTFYTVLGIAVFLLLFREAYIWFHSRYKGKNK